VFPKVIDLQAKLITITVRIPTNTILTILSAKKGSMKNSKIVPIIKPKKTPIKLPNRIAITEY
jgi:hypothetical protein